jgi:hypothetical protein
MDRDAHSPETAGESTTRWGRLLRPLQRFESLRTAISERPIVAVGGVVLFVLTVGLGTLGSLLLTPKSSKDFETEFTNVLAHLDAEDFELGRRIASDMRQQKWSYDTIAAYSSATNWYQHEPASLDANLQISACYRHLDKPKKAKGIMEQARIVLQKIPTDMDYRKTSRFSRQQWEQHLKLPN